MFKALHKPLGKQYIPLGRPQRFFLGLVFSWLTLRLHQSDLDLLFQACLFFSPVRVSSVRGLGLSLDIFQPCHRILFRAMEKRYYREFEESDCKLNVSNDT